VSLNMLKQPLSTVVLFGLLIGCSPLPTRSTHLTTEPRPVEPLYYEKKGYVITAPSPSASDRKVVQSSQRKVSAKLGQTLTHEEVSAIIADAEDKAVSAENLTQTAQSKDDWGLVMNQWKRAIAILKPAANFARVRRQLNEYERNLTEAKTQAKTNPRQITTGERSSSDGIPLIVTPAASPVPTPSPTASPTTSPSPTASPSPSPSP
jgi:hypothetical protein